jgi:hypothetical protein
VRQQRPAPAAQAAQAAHVAHSHLKRTTNAVYIQHSGHEAAAQLTGRLSTDSGLPRVRAALLVRYRAVCVSAACLRGLSARLQRFVCCCACRHTAMLARRAAGMAATAAVTVTGASVGGCAPGTVAPGPADRMSSIMQFLDETESMGARRARAGSHTDAAADALSSITAAVAASSAAHAGAGGSEHGGDNPKSRLIALSMEVEVRGPCCHCARTAAAIFVRRRHCNACRASRVLRRTRRRPSRCCRTT